VITMQFSYMLYIELSNIKIVIATSVSDDYSLITHSGEHIVWSNCNFHNILPLKFTCQSPFFLLKTISQNNCNVVKLQLDVNITGSFVCKQHRPFTDMGRSYYELTAGTWLVHGLVSHSLTWRYSSDHCDAVSRAISECHTFPDPRDSVWQKGKKIIWSLLEQTSLNQVRLLITIHCVITVTNIIKPTCKSFLNCSMKLYLWDLHMAEKSWDV